MKINLLINGSDIRAGYLNIDPFAFVGDGKLPGSFADLSEYAENAEASEIVALDVLDHLPAPDVIPTLEHWLSKLGRGGALTIGGLDLRELARQVSNHKISLDRANQLLYGGPTPSMRRKSARSLADSADLLTSKGLVIHNKVFKDVFYSVTARRP